MNAKTAAMAARISTTTVTGTPNTSTSPWLTMKPSAPPPWPASGSSLPTSISMAASKITKSTVAAIRRRGVRSC